MDQQSAHSGEPARVDLLRTLDRHLARIARLTVIVTLIVAALAFVYLKWGQAVYRTAAVEFRPVFAGAAEGRYPNELPFAPSDITASSVIDEVFTRNEVQQYCGHGPFKGGFFVEQRSVEYAFLDAEFEARLADTRLSAVDRERLQEEYRARRAGLPLQYRLVFAVPSSCEELPDALVSKSLSDVLAVWAEQSETRRGVLKLQAQVLSPSILDVSIGGEGARLVRADLIRTSLRRLIANVRAIEERPGASLVRVGPSQVAFAEVRTKFEDLVQSRLEPLVVLAGRAMGSASVAWVDEALASAQQEEQRAAGTAETYLNGLREYSGTGTAPTGADQVQPRGGDVQTLAPQIDRTFIDRILEMSEANTAFRQEMTRGMVTASVEAVEARAKVGYYQHLADALRGPSGTSLTGPEVDVRLQEIVDEGKALAQQFNALYEEWSKVSLRPAAALYETAAPVHTAATRSFTMTTLVLTVLAAMLITALLLVLGYLLLDHLQERRQQTRAIP